MFWLKQSLFLLHSVTRLFFNEQNKNSVLHEMLEMRHSIMYKTLYIGLFLKYSFYIPKSLFIIFKQNLEIIKFILLSKNKLSSAAPQPNAISI